jgi:hypothetical protein
MTSEILISPFAALSIVITMAGAYWDRVHPFSQVNIGTRESVQDLLRTLLDPLAHNHISPGGARIKVPGSTAVRFDDAAAQIEGNCFITVFSMGWSMNTKSYSNRLCETFMGLGLAFSRRRQL